jgi:hypothetical protein
MVSPFRAVKSWDLYNVQNDDVLLLEPLSASISIADTFVSIDYVDYNSGNPILNRDYDIALEQQEEEDKVIFEEGISGSGMFNPDTEPKNYTGTYKSLLYTQIYRAFYNSYRNPIEIFGMENIDFPLSKTNRYLAENFKMITVPQHIFGDKLVEGSIIFYDTTFDDNVSIYDDKMGNLVAGENLFSKVQEIRTLQNVITNGISPYICPDYTENITIRIFESGYIYITEDNCIRILDE